MDSGLGSSSRPGMTAMFPHARIVCLTEETVETLYLLGEERRIVGVSGYAVRPPQVRKEKPRVSAWLTGLKETIEELPEFVRIAAGIGVKEVYLQRLVFFDHDAVGLARPDQALFEQMAKDEAFYLEQAEAAAKSLGVTFSASGAASEPGMSLAKKRDENPWSLCRRPWTVMYFTANGRALPCCIAPFSQHGYENYTLGDATQESLRDIWNGERYQSFRAGLLSDTPPQACASCGLRWSL